MSRPDIWRCLKELTQDHTMTERITRTIGETTVTEPHIVKVPSLIDQLENAPGLKGVTGGGEYASKPAGNLEALDVLIDIDKQASGWVKDLGEDDPSSTKACVIKLGSLLPSCQKAQVDAIENDMRRWWSKARIVSGWDVAPFKPNNTCPLCENRGTLRIHQTDMTALCVGSKKDESGNSSQCGGVWDSDQIGLLAEHIRGENNDPEEVA